MTLEDRCRAFLATAGVHPAENLVEDLAAFIKAERGRASSPLLKDTEAVILYFADEQGAEEFVALIREAKPGMRAKKL